MIYCSRCGELNEADRERCTRCGTPLAPASGVPPVPHIPAAARLPVCPRCGYQGHGIGYFSRGGHVAALVGAAVLTAGAMGAAGIVYYLARREHLICPRCGHGWGREGILATPGIRAENLPVASGMGNERVWRGWSNALFVFAAVFLFIAMMAGQPEIIIGSLLAGAGGLASRLRANSVREQRRTQLITDLQHPVLRLAAENGGRLTVTQVAAQLGWPMRRAEKILDSLDDGLRVDSEVTDEGVIVYQFRELMATPPLPHQERQGQRAVPPPTSEG